MEMTNDIKHALEEIEAVADDIRVRLHLANMEAKDLWNETLAPKLEQTRAHAREARATSRKMVDETLEALKKFSMSLG